MDWKDKVVVRILMVLAQMFCKDEWKKEITALANHLHVEMMGKQQ